MQNRVISIRCEDHAGVINRITALFFARNISIHNLISCETESPEVREIFIEVPYDQKKSKYIVKLLEKLIDIIDVDDVTDEIKLGRQHTIVRLRTDINTFNLGFNDIHATFLDVKGDWIYLEINDSVENTTRTLNKLESFGKVIFVRSGSLFLK